MTPHAPYAPSKPKSLAVLVKSLKGDGKQRCYETPSSIEKVQKVFDAKGLCLGVDYMLGLGTKKVEGKLLPMVIVTTIVRDT